MSTRSSWSEKAQRLRVQILRQQSWLEDSMDCLTVNVTREDISAGVPGDSKFCSISYALTRVVKEPTTIRVYLPLVHADKHLYCLPSEARAFILRFDAINLWSEDAHWKKQQLKPFTFVMEVVK